MCGGHPRAIDKQVYNKNGPNLMGSIEDFASGTHELLALKKCKGEVGGCLPALENWTENAQEGDEGGRCRQERHRRVPLAAVTIVVEIFACF